MGRQAQLYVYGYTRMDIPVIMHACMDIPLCWIQAVTDRYISPHPTVLCMVKKVPMAADIG